MNLPNKLTVLRVIMVPFFVFFMLTDVGGAANKWIALAIFVIASLTDPFRKAADSDRDCYHCKRIYHQWIPAGCIRQRNCDRSKLLGKI